MVYYVRWICIWGLVIGCGRDPGFVNKFSGGGTASSADGEGGTDENRDVDADGADVEQDDELTEKLKRLPKFGLLVNDPECGFCHLEIYGNQVSTRTVPPLRTGSNVRVHGSWFAAQDFLANVPECGDPLGVCNGANVVADVTGGLQINYSGVEMPKDQNSDGVADFPQLDFADIADKTSGTVNAAVSNTNLSRRHQGNAVLIGTDAQPIRLEGDIFMDGDLVIKGVYEGIGTIYVGGSIYIPADLRAKRSAFPFPIDPVAANVYAEDLLTNSVTDGLGLASANSIFIADLGKQQNSDVGSETFTVYNHGLTPINRQAAALGVYGVYSWFPGGEAGYNALYEAAVGCISGAATQLGSFNTVEAFLYASNTVAGVSRRASYTIRGGVIADYLHIISGASRCDGTVGSVHGRPSNKSYVEYDYRIATGRFRILEHLGNQFPK